MVTISYVPEMHQELNEQKVEDVREELTGALLWGLPQVMTKSPTGHLTYTGIFILIALKLGCLQDNG